MDTRRFDALTGARGVRAARRGLLAWLALGGSAALSLAVSGGTIKAKRKRRRRIRNKKKRCATGRNRCAGKCCPEGTFCQHGGCFRGCSSGDTESCIISSSCSCFTTVAGPKICAGQFVCADAETCADDDDCPVGQVCVETGCCTAFGKPRTCVPAG